MLEDISNTVSFRNVPFINILTYFHQQTAYLWYSIIYRLYLLSANYIYIDKLASFLITCMFFSIFYLLTFSQKNLTFMYIFKSDLNDFAIKFYVKSAVFENSYLRASTLQLYVKIHVNNRIALNIFPFAWLKKKAPHRRNQDVLLINIFV